MKTKMFFAAIAATLVFSANSFAQDEKTLSIYAGATFVGFANTNLTHSSPKIKNSIKWTPIAGAQLGIEKRLGKVSTLWELEYAKFDYKSHDFDYMDRFNPANFDKLDVFSFSGYAGKNIGKGRVSVPLYIGLGLDYLSGYPMHNLSAHISAKARVRVYITNTFGMYVGATFKYGFLGSKSLWTENSKGEIDKSNSYSIKYMPLMLEAGMTFSIGKKSDN